MSQGFQVGDLVRVKETHLEGDGHNGYPNLCAEFKVDSFGDPGNMFQVIEIHTHQCGGNWVECKRIHGCTGPIKVQSVSSGREVNTMCFGYTSGFALEAADAPELSKEFEALGVEGNSRNVRRDP